MDKNILKWWHLNENEAFYDSKIFWALVLGWLGVAIGLSLWFAFGTENAISRCCQSDVEGFKNLFRILEIPLYLVSLSIASGVMVARFHRSKQYNRNMEITESKNDFDRRFKHEEEFGRFVSKVGNRIFKIRDVPSNSVNNTSAFDMYGEIKANPSAVLYLRFFPHNASKASGDGISITHTLLQRKFSALCASIDIGVFNAARAWELPLTPESIDLASILISSAKNVLGLEFDCVREEVSIVGPSLIYKSIDRSILPINITLDELQRILVEIAIFTEEFCGFLCKPDTNFGVVAVDFFMRIYSQNEAIRSAAFRELFPKTTKLFDGHI